MVNGNKYTMGYYLADGIYPAWAPLVKAFRNPQGNKKVHFTTMQESYRKDVERAFGVLQSRFAMIRGPARWWSKEDLWYIMMCCVILHNMIIEDEREEDEDFNYCQEPACPVQNCQNCTIVCHVLSKLQVEIQLGLASECEKATLSVLHNNVDIE